MEINILENNQEDNNAETSWLQWRTKKEKRMIRGEDKEVTLTVKETITDSIHALMDTFSMFHPDYSGSSGPLWLGDWKYQIGSSNTCTYR